MKTKRSPIRKSATQLQRFARERADAQARRIPWQRLFEARNQYIDWQEFYLWVRSILEVEPPIPDWLVEILNSRCPGFIESIEELTPKAAKERPLPLRLEDWVDDHIFGFAREEGWFSAVAFYAVREPRYRRAEVCWSESVEKWKKAKPDSFPSFAEWKEIAAQCDDTAHLLPELRRAGASAKLVVPARLAEAVSRYIDWEAFAYWVRLAMEFSQHLPAEIAHELEQRCPGFLESYRKAQQPEAGGVVPWHHLMGWIGDHCFPEAKAEGWWDAIVSAAQMHPRAIRTMEYADHCDETWGQHLPDPYPSFENWRLDADSFVELPNELPNAKGS